MSQGDHSIEDLARNVAERSVILFVGAGVSMSVGLPSWQKLTDHMADQLNISADTASGNYQAFAEFYRLKQGSLGPLRSWLDRNWSVADDKVRESKLHRLIVEMDFPIIYTTNYDRNLEVAFDIFGRDFVKVANARDLACVRPDVTQIIKFHGDFDDDDSLVLTESDYFNRLSFDSPLDIKLHSDALARTVLFIGYSLSDMNIRLLMHRLWQSWHRSGYESDRPRSFAFMPRPNPVEEALLDRWGITMLTEEADDPESALLAFMEKLRELSARYGEARLGVGTD